MHLLFPYNGRETNSGVFIVGVDHWAEEYPACGGQRQSPIDIKVKDTMKDKHLSNVDLLMPKDLTQSTSQMLNNGHSGKESLDL